MRTWFKGIMNVLSLLLVFVSVVQAKTVIDYDRLEGRPNTLLLGNVEITAGHVWSMFRTKSTTLFGSLEVDTGGGFYVASPPNSPGLQVLATGLLNNFVNQGIISFRSVNSTSGFNYDIASTTWDNTGQVFLGGKSSKAPRVSIRTSVMRNQGIISVFQDATAEGTLTMGGSGNGLVNDGVVCLSKFTWEQESQVTGKGCIRAGENSVVHIKQTLLPISQTISLDGPNAGVRVADINVADAFRVAGLGNGNFVATDGKIQYYDYDEKKGILTISADPLGLQKVKFNIGLGYDRDKFTIGTERRGGLIGGLIGGWLPEIDRILYYSCAGRGQSERSLLSMPSATCPPWLG